MTEIVIPPITGEDIENKLTIVQDTLLQPGVASALEDWTRLVTATSILIPVDDGRMPDPSSERLTTVHNNLEFLMSSQSEEVAGSIDRKTTWDIGCIALQHTLEQARDRLLDRPSSAEWPMGKIFMNGLTLQVAKTMLHLERFNDLLKSQPEETVFTIFRDSPVLQADSVVLDSDEDMWSTEGEYELVIPSYNFMLGVRAELTTKRRPENHLVEFLTLSVDEVINAVENSRIYPITDVDGDTVPKRGERCFLGSLPDDAEWEGSAGIIEHNAAFYRSRFDLVQSASSQAKIEYTEIQ